MLLVLNKETEALEAPSTPSASYWANCSLPHVHAEEHKASVDLFIKNNIYKKNNKKKC